MWGGSRVTEADIAFIAEWIDDGCPPDDQGGMPLDITTREVGRAQVHELEFGVAGGNARRYAYREGEPPQRAHLDRLSQPRIDPLPASFRPIHHLQHHAGDRR